MVCAAGLYRRPRRLDRHRSRTATLDGVWPASHGTVGHPLADRTGRDVVAARLYGALPGDVPGWPCGHASPGPPGLRSDGSAAAADRFVAAESPFVVTAA